MKLYILFFIFYFNISISQPIPNEFMEYYKKKFLMNSGENWNQNTIFGNNRRINPNNLIDSLFIDSRFGLQYNNKGKGLYGFGHFSYKNNFHGYLYSRIVNSAEFFERYSGIEREISRFGFTSGETDQSGICYESDWLIFQFGRGRESWGAGNDIQLGLNEDSFAYDYGLLDLDFGNLRVRYFNGYLETDSLSVSRYITGRGIEWNNEVNFLFGLSEVVIYSGVNRTIDFSYLNPISTHLEIELNDKQNDLGSDNGNGVWQLSMDYLLTGNFRISFNYLFDEFVFDQVQKDANKNSEGGYSIKFLHSDNYLSENNTSNIFVSYINIGTNTFRHEDGNNNFVIRGKPLGWRFGSDGREYRFGLNNFNKKLNMFTNICFGRRDTGLNSIMENPYHGYTNYNLQSFPSGDFKKIYFFKIEFQWWYKPYISLMISYQNDKILKHFHHNEFKAGLDAYFPFKTKI